MAARRKNGPRQNAPTRVGPDGLTDYKRRFVAAYLQDPQATSAAITAGFKGKNPSDAGWRLLNDPAVRKAIDEAQAKLASKAMVDAERIIAEYSKIAFSNILDFVQIDEKTGVAYVDLTKVTRENGAAIAQLEVEQTEAEYDKEGREKKPALRKIKLKQHDKLDALHKLGIHIGMFKDGGVQLQEVNFIIIGDPKFKRQGAPVIEGKKEVVDG